MWTRPRATTRHLVAHRPAYGVLTLAALAGVGRALDRASDRNLGDAMSVPAIVGTAVVTGPIAGILGLYLIGWLTSVTGRWIGGHAGPPELRTALAWGSLPTVAGLLLWIPALALLGRDMFTETPAAIIEQPILGLMLLPLVVIWIGLGIWSLVLVLHAVGEVQGFSAWKALGNLALALVLILAAIVPLVLLAGILAFPAA